MAPVVPRMSEWEAAQLACSIFSTVSGDEAAENFMDASRASAACTLYSPFPKVAPT